MLKILIVGFPFLDLIGLLLFAEAAGSMWTLLEIVLTLLLGVQFIKRSGQSIQSSLGALQRMGTQSASEIINPIKGIIGGLLLCVPGLLSDGVAVIILLGYFRSGAYSTSYTTGRQPPFEDGPLDSQRPSGRIIEGEYSAEVLVKKEDV